MTAKFTSLSRRPGPIAAFLRRDFAIAASYRLPFISDAFYGLLQLAVSYFVFQTFEDAATVDLSGAPDYFSFAAVGIVLGLVVETASSGLAQRVREEQLSGSLEALLAQPLSIVHLCLGLTAFPFVFAVGRAALYLIVAGVWMGLDLTHTSWIGLTLIFLMSAAALGGVGIVAGAAMLVFKQGQALAGMVLFALILGSGSVFPVEILPSPLGDVSRFFPLRYAFGGARDALFQGSGWLPDVLALTGFTAVGLPLAVRIFGRALEHTRQTGSLGEY